MARALNKVMSRRGPVFADRYHAHLLISPIEAFQAIRYVLANWAVHAARENKAPPMGPDPYSSAWPHDCGPPLVARAEWWLLCVGVPRAARLLQLAKVA